jgi:Arc/MetJ family transcription regulator
MSKTLIDVDDELLAWARQILGTRTKKETVNSALREIVRQASAREFTMPARNGIFGGVDRA